MSRVSLAERTRLSMYLARRGMRNIAGRLRGHPLLRWNLLPGKTDRLLIAPQDLRTADPTRASENLCGPIRLRRQGCGLPTDARHSR